MSLHDQIHFTAKSSCKEYTPNSFKKEKCTNCCYLFTDHESNNVTEDNIRNYLDHINSKNPCNEILPAKDGLGILYLGSYQALLESNIKKYKITKAVQTAINLEKFFAGWGNKLEVLEKNGVVEIFRTYWLDSNQKMYVDTPWDTVINAIEFIHKHRMNGENVLVNCAQGKSRSTTIVISYLMALQKLTPTDALAFIKTKRSLAEPNQWFMNGLEEFYKSDELAQIQQKLE